MGFATNLIQSTEDPYKRRDFMAQKEKPAPKETKNLEYIGKSILGAGEDIVKAGALLIGGSQEALKGGTQAEVAELLGQAGIDTPATEEQKNILFDYILKPSAIGAMPTAEETNWSVRTIGDVGRAVLPFVATGIAGGTATLTAKTGIESIEQGMDVATTQKRMVAAGAGALVMAEIAPFTTKGMQAIYANNIDVAVKELAKSTLLNVGTGIATRGIDYQIVKDKYPEIAKQIEVVGVKSVGTDIAMMGVFGYIGYRQAAREMKANGITPKEAQAAFLRVEEAIESDTALHDAVTMQRKRYADIENSPLLDSPQPWVDAQAMLERGMKALDEAVPLADTLPKDVPYKQTPPERVEIIPIKEPVESGVHTPAPEVPASLIDDNVPHIKGDEIVKQSVELPPELKPDILPPRESMIVEVSDGMETIQKPAKEAIEILDKKSKRYEAFKECMR